jgi:carboxyl-terminal processing protease
VKKQSFSYIQVLLPAFFIAAGVIIGILLTPSSGSPALKNRISETLGLINLFYVDSVESSKIEEEAIAEILKSLDPHSVFISSADIKAVNEPLEGEFEGIGVEFNILEDTIYIVNVIRDGPSENAGLRAGDRIIRVDDSLVAGIKITNEEVIRKLKGKKNTKVKVSILRNLDKSFSDYIIRRGTIPVHSVDASYMADPMTGYIRLVRFSATTHEEVKAALKDLKKQGMKNLIFDLRGNPGGYLSAAIQVADEFIDGSKLLVYTEGRSQPKKTYKARETGLFESGKLVILIDEQSASASEIVSGAVQDWDRGLIIGRRSYGKGLVQEPFTLSDGSAIRLTVSRYYTPTGRSIQKPYSDGYDLYQQEVTGRWEHGEMEYSDSVRSNDSLRYLTPGGRTVYGGGGIYPDIFVAVDTSYSRTLLSGVYRKYLHRRFVYSFLESHRAALKEYGKVKSFITSFEWKPADKEEFKRLLISQGVKWTEEDWKKSEFFIFNEMKAVLARQLFDINAYYMVSNQDDTMIRTALKALSEYGDGLVAGK